MELGDSLRLGTALNRAHFQTLMQFSFPRNAERGF